MGIALLGLRTSSIPLYSNAADRPLNPEGTVLITGGTGARGDLVDERRAGPPRERIKRPMDAITPQRGFLA